MLTCDVTSVAKLVDDALAEAGRIDLLVKNAGLGLLGGAEESSIDQAKALFEVNVFGVLRVTNAVLPTMRRQGKGRIVNVSSVQGFIPVLYFALYSSTKHAIEGYSESLHHELRPFGIRVALVEPAYTSTSFEDNLAQPDQSLEGYGSARAGIIAAVLPSGWRTKAGELVTPRNLISRWKSFDMELEPWSWRRMKPAPAPVSSAPKCFATPCRSGSSASQRLAPEAAWTPTNSPEQWSTAMNT